MLSCWEQPLGLILAAARRGRTRWTARVIEAQVCSVSSWAIAARRVLLVDQPAVHHPHDGDLRVVDQDGAGGRVRQVGTIRHLPDHQAAVGPFPLPSGGFAR